MERVLVTLFWLCLAGAVGAVLLVDDGIVKWLSLGLVATVGALSSATNWHVVVRGNGSLVPLLGAALLVLAVAALPIGSLRWWAPAAALLDPWTVLIVISPFARRRSGNSDE